MNKRNFFISDIDLSDPQWAVTACFTHHNRPKKLRRALERLWHVSEVPLTVRVHDNGSTQNVDTELEAMRNEGLIDELIHTDENLGIAGSRHLLLDPDNIKTEFVIVLDDDMYVGDGWDHAMLPIFESAPKVGVVGAPFMIPGMGGIRDGGQIFTWTDGYPILDSGRNVLARDDTDYSNIADPEVQYILVDDVPMGSSLIRHDVLSDVSLPERKTFEDIAFSLDVAEAGWEIAMSCDTIFYHDKHIEDGANHGHTDWNAKREGYRDFCQKRDLRFSLRQHLLHEIVFAAPNPILWTISDLKNRRLF